MRAACSAEFRPDIVIGVGGYASGPAMLAAILKGIPTLAFEPNVVPGFANRMVAQKGFRRGGPFRGDRAIFPQCRSHRRAGARSVFRNRRQDRPHMTSPPCWFSAGSQGANAINQAMIQCLPELVRQVPDIHIIHQTGERDYNDAQAAYRKAGSSAEVFPFITDMPAFFARADCCCAGQAQAPWRKSRQRASRRFLFLFRAPRTIISA